MPHPSAQPSRSLIASPQTLQPGLPLAQRFAQVGWGREQYCHPAIARLGT
jgi:hypothetical protein